LGAAVAPVLVLAQVVARVQIRYLAVLLLPEEALAHIPAMEETAVLVVVADMQAVLVALGILLPQARHKGITVEAVATTMVAAVVVLVR
jgi:hypothetical protein